MAYQPLDHTGDLGVEVTAASLAELFAESIRAQTDCLTRLERVAEKESRRVEMTAPELPDLLVDFLSEAIYLYETEGLVMARAIVEVTRGDDGWSVIGVLRGEPFELARHGLKTLLKAVTYHQLSVRQHRDVWTARIIFDI